MFEKYLAYRQHFGVSRKLAVQTLAWAEPLARQALGAHSQRDQMGLGEQLQYISVMTTPENNGGWGELMPAWFKPYQRPLPIFILDNWAMLALLWEHWLGDIGTAYSVENLLKIFLGGDLLIPFLPKVQGGGHFLRQGTFSILLGLLWLEPADRDAFIAGINAGADQFANNHLLKQQSDLESYLSNIEFEAFFVAEGSKIGGQEKVRAFLENELQFKSYAALFGGLCFTLASLVEWYGTNWQDWIFQKVNVDYRSAAFALEAWAQRLGVAYVHPLPDPEITKMFRAEGK